MALDDVGVRLFDEPPKTEKETEVYFQSGHHRPAVRQRRGQGGESQAAVGPARQNPNLLVDATVMEIANERSGKHLPATPAVRVDDV
jgi:hypothetical protein